VGNGLCRNAAGKWLPMKLFLTWLALCFPVGLSFHALLVMAVQKAGMVISGDQDNLVMKVLLFPASLEWQNDMRRWFVAVVTLGVWSVLWGTIAYRLAKPHVIAHHIKHYGEARAK
jgi:hypothetical protein